MNENIIIKKNAIIGLFDKYLAEEDRRLLGAGFQNDNIFVKKLTAPPPIDPNFTKIPHSVFFYYLRINNSGKLKISHFFEGPTVLPIDPDENGLKVIITRLAKNARKKNPTNPPPTAINLEQIEWDRKSYIILFIDEANWDFHKQDDEALVFLTEKGSIVKTPNHTFYDAKILEIEMPNRFTGQPDMREALVFINHMKADETGRDLGGPYGEKESRDYQFNILFDVTFEDGTSAPMVVIFDPTGTNLGPPEPPPVP